MTVEIIQAFGEALGKYQNQGMSAANQGMSATKQSEINPIIRAFWM